MDNKCSRNEGLEPDPSSGNFFSSKSYPGFSPLNRPSFVPAWTITLLSNKKWGHRHVSSLDLMELLGSGRFKQSMMLVVGKIEPQWKTWILLLGRASRAGSSSL
ncbi:hypothetical protein QQ045_016758 [Rhodiola kirilowii]